MILLLNNIPKNSIKPFPYYILTIIIAQEKINTPTKNCGGVCGEVSKETSPIISPLLITKGF